MKRSEMIAILRDALYKHCVIEYNDIMDGDSDISKILDEIEEAGMLPPAMDFYFEKECSKEELDYSIYDFRFEWEPEDE
jgi:hypothetical protein